MADAGADKSHEATPHRRQQAREEGQVPRSQDLGSAVMLLAGIGILLLLGRRLVDLLGGLAQAQLREAQFQIDVDQLTALARGLARELAYAVLPVLGLVLLAAVAINLAQVGLLFVPQRLAPDITRLDPIKGLGRIFSLSGLMRVLLGLFKIAVVGAVAIVSVWSEWEQIVGLALLEPVQIAQYLIKSMIGLGLKCGLALLLLALIDYLYQRWQHEQDLRMTTQEVREEMRNLQGDPQVAARRRTVQRQLALNRLAQDVPTADVVVTNPTELAVAIRYDPETMAAPIVVAKGAGVIAQRIRRLALEHGIPIVEKKPLARALYKEVDVQKPVPATLYSAVAELLAYVYQLKGKRLPQRPGGYRAA